MRSSKLRNYVLNILKEKNGLSREEIVACVNEQFGENMYTETQVKDLLYNLRRVGKVSKQDNGVFVVPDMTESINQKEITIELNLDSKIGILKKQCMMFVETVDQPELFRNVQMSKYNITEIERLYNLSKKILEIVK